MRTLMIAVVAAISLGSTALACDRARAGERPDSTQTEPSDMPPATDNAVTSLEDIAPGFDPDDEGLDPLGPRESDRLAAEPAGERVPSEGRALEIGDLQETPVDDDTPDASEPAPAHTAEPRQAGGTPPESEPARTSPAPASTSGSVGRVNFSLEEIRTRRAGMTVEGGAVPAGSVVPVRLDQQLSTSGNAPGDPFTATTLAPLRDEAGREVIPAGAVVRGSVLAVDDAEEAGETSMLVLGFESVSAEGVRYPLRGTVIEAHPERRKPTATRGTAAKVGAGAAVGAILGQIIGKDTEATVIGAAAGAAAGTAIALGTRDVEAVLPEGSRMTVRLDAPIPVR